jgi:hypothetical protein
LFYKITGRLVLLKKLLFILCAFFVIPVSSCSGKYPVDPRTDLSAETDRYQTALAGSAGFARPVEIILHRAGSYQEYATDINCSQFPVSAPATDVCVLMDLSFNEYAASAIEIDLRTVPGNPEFNKVYIVHNAINPEFVRKDFPAIKEYLRKNSIDVLIKHFIEKKYYAKNKKIYIELKLPRKSLFSNNASLDRNEEEYVRACVSAVQDAVRINAKSPAVQKRICDSIDFISFNYFALEQVFVFAGDRFGLHFLAATNRLLLGRAACIEDYELNYLNDPLIRKLAAASWLRGIWFDPRGVVGSARIFNSINDARRASGKTPVYIFLFVYELKFEDLVSTLTDSAMHDENGTVRPFENIKGICYEMSRFGDRERKASCR